MSGESFVDELVAAMPTPQARLILISRLAKYSGKVIYLPVESKKERRVRAALNMLQNGMAPADAATALVERFGVAVRTAQRDITAARQMSQKTDAGGRSN